MVEVYAQGNLLFFFLVRHAPKNSIFDFFQNQHGRLPPLHSPRQNVFKNGLKKKNLKILPSTKNQEYPAFSCLRQL